MTETDPPAGGPYAWAGRAPHPIVELDAGGGVRWANSAARALVGIGDAGEGPGDLERCRALLPDDLEDVLVRCLDSGEDVDGVEVSIGDGTLSWCFRPDEAADVVGAFGVDVTDWNESEKALRRKDRLLEAVGSAARIILGSTDPGLPAAAVLEKLGVATGVSRVYLFRNSISADGRLLASQVSEWSGPGVESQIDNPELQEVPYDAAGMARWARELGQGHVIAGTVEEFPADERELLRAQDILSLVVAPVILEGRLWGFLGFDDCVVPRRWSASELEVLRAAADTIAAAIARQEALEELETNRAQLRQGQRMEAIGRLAGGVAHDFNNLLTGILADAEVLLEDLPSSGPGHDEAAQIRKTALRAAGLTRQLLAFSRKEAIRPGRLVVSELVSDMEQLIRRLIGENIEVDTRIDADAPAVWADSGQVEQIILNLVINARDAMPEGGSLVLDVLGAQGEDEALRPGGLEAAGDWMLLRVRDTGVGMDPETAARAFEPFFTTKASGTGMGLSIVYGVAHQSGGSTWVESEVGEGTTVTVALPALEDGDDRLAGGAASHSERQDLSGHETIVVVEDDDTVRSVTRRILERAGYHVLEASTARDGLDLVQSDETDVDLLLTDVGLPDRSGTDLAREVADILPDLPVMFVSGFPGQRPSETSRVESPPDFLPKPFTHEQLLRRVRAALSGPAGGSGGDRRSETSTDVGQGQ